VGVPFPRLQARPQFFLLRVIVAEREGLQQIGY